MPGLSVSRSWGQGRGLLHPRGDEAFVEVVRRLEIDPARGLADPGRLDWRFGREIRAAPERELDVAGEAAAREPPAVADAVPRNAPLHGALEVRQRLRRKGIDAFGDRSLRLRQAGDGGNTGLSPTVAFAVLTLPVIAAGSRSAPSWGVFPLSAGSRTPLPTWFAMAPPDGFEPPTPALGRLRSIH